MPNPPVVDPPKGLTLLSQPPLLTRQWLARQMYVMTKRLWQTIHGKGSGHVRGPEMVQRNLVAGLQQLDYPFLVNPPAHRVTPRVGVLSSVSALRWANRAKRRGRIQRLLAGPNLVVTPLEAKGILCAPEIDLVVTPCQWVSDLYRTVAPQLAGKLAIWPVGVDTDYWRPDASIARAERKGWLIYDKTARGGQSILAAVLADLARLGEPVTVMQYGAYEPMEYRQALQQTKGMVVLSPSESQGIAQMEAWACDVPTLVWDRRRWEWNGMVFDAPSVSSAPYLDLQCGLRFADADEFPGCMAQMLADLDHFTPRDYTVRHFSLAATAKAYSCL